MENSKKVLIDAQGENYHESVKNYLKKSSDPEPVSEKQSEYMEAVENDIETILKDTIEKLEDPTELFGIKFDSLNIAIIRNAFWKVSRATYERTSDRTREILREVTFAKDLPKNPTE
jgi:ribulose kinase